MKEIRALLDERELALLQLKKEKEKGLQTAPEGLLRINMQNNIPYYYLRTDPKNFNGSYIKKENFPLVQQLAQKDYDTKVLRSIDQELAAIRKYRASAPTVPAENIYETLHPNRQPLITPIQEPDDQFIKNWLDVKYQGKYFDENMPELYTSKGERVRSKSEIIIADLLARASIPYRYEYPLHLKGFGRIYPDFTVLHVEMRKEIYWDHFGMMDDPDYAAKAVQKIATYEQHGFFPGENLILTYETRLNPINPKQVQALIQHYLL